MIREEETGKRGVGKGFEYLKWIGNIVVMADSISALK